MGVYRVGIAYILLGGLGFIMLTAGMILVRFDYIFKKEKPKRVARRTTENPKQKTQFKWGGGSKSFGWNPRPHYRNVSYCVLS